MTDNSGIKFGNVTITKTVGDGIHIEGDVRGLQFDEVNLTDIGGRGIFVSKESKRPTLEGVPPDQLLATLQAFIAAAPKTQAEAEAALKPTGIEKWLTKGSTLAVVAASLLNSIEDLEEAVKKLLGG